ncbi:UNVERIFIED_CONTAM: hypothetical protein Slati_4449900 [Sesamum latifolium]|uniref:Gag-asp_proteas domain-containing protein n=1 Tax=Sesamum latifolium TaxID=2727402 RepID=A0AAW2SRS6_9LAMI
MGQLVSIVSGRKEGQLPGDTEKNPREQVNAITLKSGETIEDEHPKKQVEGTQVQKEDEPQVEIRGSPSKLNLDAIPPYIPYPSRILKMSSYAKKFKKVISNKRKWEGGETVKLNEECSAILQDKLPPKLKDPGSFSIPCTIGNTNFDKALCDLGASVNLMSYSIFKKLGMNELTPTIITLQLADRSIKYLRGIVRMSWSKDDSRTPALSHRRRSAPPGFVSTCLRRCSPLFQPSAQPRFIICCSSLRHSPPASRLESATVVPPLVDPLLHWNSTSSSASTPLVSAVCAAAPS